ILNMLLGDMKVMIPVENVDRVGLRHVINDKQLAEIESVLEARPENTMKSITWNRRFNLYLDKMKSGDAFQVAEVVRVLTVQENSKKLSTGERRLLNTAKQILLSEIMLIRSQTTEEADAWLNKFFN
ncbi:MAG: CarD family transcriptional regulator, partial [Acidaminococcaceae bacterium]